MFGYEGKFRYTYDLADCWRELTGKPFVFAVWVARKGSAPELIDALESSLDLGVERIWEAIVERGHSEKDYAYGYLTENIDFLFDYQKKAGAGALPRQGEEVHTTRQSGLSCVRGSATEPFERFRPCHAS